MCEHARSMGGETDAPSGFHRRVFTQLRGLFATLQHELRDPKDQSAEKIARVSDVIAAAQLDRSEWGDFTSWRGDKYTRNLVAHDENFTVLMLCWNKSQKSPIHDHAGSSCWVRVLDGELRERRFAMPVEGAPVHAPELLSDATVVAGDVTYIDDTQALHEMGNWHPDKVTVTMHVYSPPYFKCFAFDEFTGARRNVSMLAATAPPREILGADETDEIETPLSPTGQPLRLEDLEALLDAPDSTEASIVDAFKHVRFTREEWSTFAHFSDLRYQRLMLHHNTRFSLLMLCWLPGHATPPHTHVDSRSWVRVLAGELTYTEPALVREGSQEVDLTAPPRRIVVMRRGDPPFAEDDALAVHQVGNMGKRFAVSLHLYTPPYTEFRNAETTVPFVHAQRRLLQAAVPCCPSPRRTSCEGKPSGSASAIESRADSSVLAGATPQRCHLSGFYMLVERLTEIFALPAARHPSTGKLNLPELSEAVMRALEAQQFDAAEVARYWGVRERIDYRVKLHESAEFDVVLNLWAVGHHSVVHDHDGAVSWMKVLEGNLLDITYDEDPEAEALVVEGTTRAQTGSVLFHGARSRHALRSPGPHPAISLHVYAPGGRGCKWFTLAQPRHGVRVQSMTASEGDAWNILGPVVQHDGVTGTVQGLPLDFAYCI